MKQFYISRSISEPDVKLSAGKLFKEAYEMELGCCGYSSMFDKYGGAKMNGCFDDEFTQNICCLDEYFTRIGFPGYILRDTDDGRAR